MKTKVKKIMLWPSRTLELPKGGGYAKLSAGIELEFDQAVELDSKEAKEALNEGRSFIQEEFKKQYEPYKQFFKSESKK